MKKVLLAFGLILGFISISAQTNFDLTTLRIGAYTLKMNVYEAEKLAGKTLPITDYDKPVKVNYYGEVINLNIFESYVDEKNPNVKNVGSLSTTSKKFRTKSGMGVGSTKDELIDAYRNYPNFEYNTGWGDNGKPKKEEGFFSLRDNDASTILSFKLINNVVTEVSVYFNEGC